MDQLLNLGGGPADAGLIKDSSTREFRADVLEASRQVPVIVDFWAPWCGPCKQLGPLLEKVVRDSGGAVRLVKIDIDQNPEIAQQMRIRSIPAVFAFHNGQPVDGFAGALPESQIREFVSRISGGAAGGSPLEEALAEAEAMMERGDFRGAGGLFGQIRQHDPENAAAAAGQLRCLIAIDQHKAAKRLLEELPAALKSDKAVRAAAAALELADQAAGAGNAAALRRAVAAAPDDHQARIDLAMALYGAGDRKGAVEALLDSIRLDRDWNEGAARKQLLKFFESFGPTDPLTVESRRRLSSLLFS